VISPAKILVVEDDRVVARDIQQQLIRIGHTVVGVTAHGEASVQLAQEQTPEIVLMDIRLEGPIDGVAAAEQIRERSRIPVIFLTAYSDEETVRRATRAEPFGYLLKPFDEYQLRTAIDMALYKHAAERKLRESERRYATTLSSIGDAVISTDSQGRVTFMNPTAEMLTAWPMKDAIGRPLPDVFRIINEETRKPVEDPAAKVLRLGAVVGLANHTALITRDGRELPIDDCGAPIVDDGGKTTGAVLVFRDMTQRRLADEALRKSQEELTRVVRLTTMGELTVSIAHEVNQPLMAIMTNANACLQWLTITPPDLAEAADAAKRIVRDSQRAGDLIKSIRALATKSSPKTVLLDINVPIREALIFIRSELRRHAITIEHRLSSNLQQVWGDRVQLQQVVLNLMVNSIEAMSAGISQQRILQVSSEMDEVGCVLISISDTGVGLDPTKIDRIFEPFFSTKPDGIGMGLSICRSIVEAHGGRLWASPNLPYGSTFRFTVPAVTDGVSSESSA
jgi:PAS domain S-box-containing protein